MHEAIRETWGAAFIDHGAEVFFTVSDPDWKTSPAMKGDFLHTAGLDRWKGLTNRMIWLMDYMVSKDFTHLLTIDDDCSVDVPLFMTLPWQEAELYGVTCAADTFSGCCTVWSKKAVCVYHNTMNRDDVSCGPVLKSRGIKFTSAAKDVIRPWTKHLKNPPEGDEGA